MDAVHYKALANAWRMMAEARQEMLIAYRFQGQIKESTWKKLDKAREALAKLNITENN